MVGSAGAAVAIMATIESLKTWGHRAAKSQSGSSDNVLGHFKHNSSVNIIDRNSDEYNRFVVENKIYVEKMIISDQLRKIIDELESQKNVIANKIELDSDDIMAIKNSIEKIEVYSKNLKLER